MYATLRARAAGMVINDYTITRILCSSGGGEEIWTQVLTISVVVRGVQIAMHRKALHGWKRLEMRKACSSYNSWVMKMREQGKAGKVINAVFEAHAGQKYQDKLVMDVC